jgi:acyl-CoA thioester hydrolase
MKVTVPFEVLWGEADPSGWIYYAAALRYVAEAEAKLYRKIGMLTYQMMDQGYANPRVNLSIQYIKPFKVHDQGLIHAWIDKIGTSSVTMVFELTDKNNKEVYIKGSLVTVIIDIETEKAIPVPEKLRNGLYERK